MALRLDDKKTVVEEVAAIAGQAHSAIAAEYRGRQPQRGRSGARSARAAAASLVSEQTGEQAAAALLATAGSRPTRRS